MSISTSRASAFSHASKSGSHDVYLEFIWAHEMGGVAQAVIATFAGGNGSQRKQFIVLGPFSESGSARKAVMAKADAWFDYGQE